MVKQALLVVVFAALVAPVSMAEEGIAVVDSRRIRTEYNVLVQARESAQEMFQEEQRELDDQFQALLERMKKLQERQRAGELSDELFERESNSIRVTQNELVQRREMKQRNWDEYVEARLGPLYENVRGAIETVGKEGNYAVVLSSRVVEYWAPANDITDRVLAQLNGGGAR